MSGAEKKDYIIINDAYENNLKHINVKIPINKLTCVVGVSGCGKSSLVYDTLYAESQRGFLESMSGNMFGQKLMDKPHVDSIVNLKPTLSVSQNYYNYNPRSTIGTLSDVSHYLRTLYALVINQRDGLSLKENFFSFNDPKSCCDRCNGLGEEYAISMEALIPDDEKTLKQGGITYYKGKETSLEYQILKEICYLYNIDLNKKICDLSEHEKEILLFRKNSDILQLKFKTPKGRVKQKSISSKGVVEELREKLIDIDTPSIFSNIFKYLKKQECSFCKGDRLSKKVLGYYICDSNIADVENKSLIEFKEWIKNVRHKYKSTSYYLQIDQLINQIMVRVESMIKLKIGYLSLSRSIPTLSSGELQRVRICNQLNCPLTGLVYILDEPCKGLHYRDIFSIINATKELVSKGNTVISIEHNEKYISVADSVIELGPEGGPKGGYILNYKKRKEKDNIKVIFKQSSISSENKWIKFENILFRNIKNQNAEIPLGKITCITGVSGSGKSTLVSVIDSCISKGKAINCRNYVNPTKMKCVDYVNQQPIGKTPRSTVASYLDVFDSIRQLFAKTETAKKRGFTASDFSMNVKGGRCECCQGTGLQKIELNYLPDSFIECPECEGRRFHDDVLEVKYRGYNITEILNIPVNEIIEVFNDCTSIYSKLKCMVDIGLGYISLGQMSMNLSGGEAQRVKLAKSLGNSTQNQKIYILDEPTSGLHKRDIAKFESVILNLNEQGKTIIIIEHNIEFIAKVSDYLLDFGVKSGIDGGIIVSKGIPEEVYKNTNSSWYDYNQA